ncbi:hypothetical protein [Streptomonospora litoralis]|uniref:hypothetical protein n=1 Tax=Streptomonospora litoralis TaxID=2498135 RepID=UPI001036EE7F|nr:hypothetical protein [Streptomonospora litoralis]
MLVVLGGVGFWLLGTSNGGSSGSSGSAGQGGGSLERYQGTWDGSLEQYDAGGNSMGTWSLTLEIDGERIAGEEYGLTGTEDGRCTWEIADTTLTRENLRFAYSVADDPDCVDNGAVTLTPAGDDGLEIVVVSTMQDGSESTSSGIIQRQ